MDMLRFMTISSIEYFIMITLMFAIFRFQFRGVIPHTIFICLLLSFFSHTARDAGIGQFTSLMQAILFVVCISLLYNVHWFYSIIMGALSYHAYVAIQTVTLAILTYFKLAELGDFTYDTVKGVILVFSTMMIPLLISYALRKTGWGFTFVPSSTSVKPDWSRKVNWLMLLLSLLSLMMVGAVTYFFSMDQKPLFVTLSFVQIFILVILIYYSAKKEELDE